MDSEGVNTAFEAKWLPFILGSLPYANVDIAWRAILRRFVHVPSWPQLSRRSHLENMYVQVSERFPGITLGERIYIDRKGNLDGSLERLYLAYLENDLEYGRISASYAAGFDALRQEKVSFSLQPLALKGQMIGPVSWGLTVVDDDRRPILYDEVLVDAVGKHLRLKASWQEREMQRFAPQTIMVVNEPYMAALGSAFISLSQTQVVELLAEVFAGLQGIKSIHCCGNADWSVVLRTPVDILSLDAYDYSENLALYSEEVDRFLERGGIIAWGIVPASIASEKETVESLVRRLHEAIGRLVEKGISEEVILASGMVTPSRGLGSLSPALADLILDLTIAVSSEMRQRYVRSGAPVSCDIEESP